MNKNLCIEFLILDGKSFVNNLPWKKIQYQTESNKFYTLFENEKFDKESGVILNPYKDTQNNLDKEIVVIKETEVEPLICFNIRQIQLGLFLEIYTLNSDQVVIIADPLELETILELIKKLNQFNFNSAIKYLKLKYKLRSNYLFYQENY